MAKALKVNPMEKDLPLTYTKHYYIGSERVSAKTGTMDKLGYYPLHWVTSEMPFLNIGIQDRSAERFVKAANVVASINQLFGSSLPALNTTDNYIDLYDATHYLEKMDVYYFHPDHLGSSSYITNMAGMVSQHMEYLPFGELLVDEHKNSYNSPFKYNGKEFDEETGNYFYGARYYDPKWSIFISVDPLAEQAPDWTPYRYGFNNPIRYTDPTGMYENDDYYFNENGQYLYSDTRTSENIRVISNKDWNNISEIYGKEIKDNGYSYEALLSALDSKSRLVTEESSGSKFASMISSSVERIGYSVLNFEKATLSFEIEPTHPEATAYSTPNKYKAGDRHDNGGIVLGNAHTHPMEHTYIGKNSTEGIVTDKMNFNLQYSQNSGDGNRASTNGPTYTISKNNVNYFSPKGINHSTNNVSSTPNLINNNFNLNRNALFKKNGL